MAQRNLPEMPNGPVLELYGQRKRFSVPPGLKCLLEELSREILRDQPTNIYEFLASYLEEKLRKQCGGDERRKSWEFKRWSWDGSSLLTDEELMQFLEEHNLTFSEANRIAVVIQSVYRGFKARNMVKGLRESLQKDDLDIEYDGEDTYWVYDSNGQMIRFTADDVEQILKDYNLSQDEANKYAIKIQKTFRGYRTRESFQKDFPDLAQRLEALENKKQVKPNLDVQATKIQAAYRGYKARKNLSKQKMENGEEEEEEEEGEGEDYYEEMGGEDYILQSVQRMKKDSQKRNSSSFGLASFGITNVEDVQEDEETDYETADEEEEAETQQFLEEE